MNPTAIQVMLKSLNFIFRAGLSCLLSNEMRGRSKNCGTRPILLGVIYKGFQKPPSGM